MHLHRTRDTPAARRSRRKTGRLPDRTMRTGAPSGVRTAADRRSTDRAIPLQSTRVRPCVLCPYKEDTRLPMSVSPAEGTGERLLQGLGVASDLEKFIVYRRQCGELQLLQFTVDTLSG